MSCILVVDDEPSILRMISKILQREGHTLLTAKNGNEALVVFGVSDIDLVIVDIIMPEKEGIETIMDLRGKSPDLNIIAMSGGGYANPEGYLITAKALGANATLLKPFNREDLLAAVDSLL
jgi:DNA-binding response OmpR family regulator